MRGVKRERFDDKNGRGGAQLGADYYIPLLWLQDQGFMSEEDETSER